MPFNENPFPVWGVVVTALVVLGVAVMAVRGRKRQLWWRGDKVTSAEVAKDRKLRLKLKQRHQYE
jgi:hypothetical protein